MNITKQLYDQLKELGEAILDEKGNELLNPVPTKLRIGMKRPLTLREQIQRIIKTDVSLQAQAQGLETFEEAEDFDIPDDSPEFLDNDTRYVQFEEEFLTEPEAVLRQPVEPGPVGMNPGGTGETEEPKPKEEQQELPLEKG